MVLRIMRSKSEVRSRGLESLGSLIGEVKGSELGNEMRLEKDEQNSSDEVVKWSLQPGIETQLIPQLTLMCCQACSTIFMHVEECVGSLKHRMDSMEN